MVFYIKMNMVLIRATCVLYLPFTTTYDACRLCWRFSLNHYGSDYAHLHQTRSMLLRIAGCGGIGWVLRRDVRSYSPSAYLKPNIVCALASRKIRYSAEVRACSWVCRTLRFCATEKAGSEPCLNRRSNSIFQDPPLMTTFVA